MSQIYVSAIVALLALFLPKIGVSIGSEELTTTVQTIVITVSAIWIMIRRKKLGGINVLGVRN